MIQVRLQLLNYDKISLCHFGHLATSRATLNSVGEFWLAKLITEASKPQAS